MTTEPMRLSSEDLFSPRVEGYLEEQAVANRPVPEALPRPLIVRILYSSWFYLSIASMIGALAAWASLEPLFVEGAAHTPGAHIINIVMFPAITAGVGLFLGAAEGIMCRNLLRATISAAVGLGMGFIGGLVVLLPANWMYGIMGQIAFAVGPADPGHLPSGFGLLVLMMGRGAAWAISAIPAGIGPGIAMRERKVAINGLVGAVLGGLLGGMLFDPIYLLLAQPGNASASRAVGFAFIGALVGLFVGLVEQWTKTAWLYMKAGPLAGKQFVIFRNPTVLGSSPKADIYLFKDEAIEPRHALLHNRGGRFELEDCDSGDGTYVNGRPIKKQILHAGDQIVLGKTVLEFALKEA
jgi:hypothetical protein